MALSLKTEFRKFMFTNTPDMSDEQFAGQTSGEAMKYKLFGLEQRTAIKEGLFEKVCVDVTKLIGQIMRSIES